MKKILLPLLVGAHLFALPLIGWAQPQCAQIFQKNPVEAIITERGMDFGFSRFTSTNYETPKDLLEWKNNKKHLEAYLLKMNESDRNDVQHILDSAEFFDFSHTSPNIFGHWLNGYPKKLDFHNLYDQANESEPGIAFNGFLSARNFLKTKRPAINSSLLLNLHELIMEKGVEGVQAHQLGIYRNGHWIGNAAGSSRIFPSEKLSIDKNPYLFFEQTSLSQSKGPLGELWQRLRVWLNKTNDQPTTKEVTLISGKIHYPFVLTPKLETIELIKNSHSKVYREIIEFREHSKKDPYLSPSKELEQKMTQALLEERFDRFNSERKSLGHVQLGKNEKAYIDLVASFQRDIVAIHPLLNGNGRSTRLLMNYLLTSEGLPPVRLVDPMLDVQVTKDEWAEYVHKGVLNTSQLYADILFRIRNNLDPLKSPELIYPGLPEEVSIALKKQGLKKIEIDYARKTLSGDQFLAFTKLLVEQHPEIQMELKNNRIQTMSQIAELFVEYYKTKNFRYLHEKDGEQDISLNYVDEAFESLFAIPRAHDIHLWNDKISKWYGKKEIVWRGLSNQTKEFSDVELISLFQNLNPHLMSANALTKVNQGMTALEAIKKDFSLYNQELLNGELITMAIDHHRTGPRYSQSYGYSTSKREIVGKGFAMGAMVLGAYGTQNKPELQARLKSRINVGQYRAMKDIDLGRLKAFNEDFDYIYGRQAEVMGIGGTDPDAVMIVQKINAEGEVEKTFIRNPKDPNEVLIVNGKKLLTDKIESNEIIERIKLFD